MHTVYFLKEICLPGFTVSDFFIYTFTYLFTHSFIQPLFIDLFE